ncbi:electron transport complex subunit RsxG [Pseudoalteromonas fenneropenaei]|uniref:Ion-translocating oxidoreductase complex subunit G n=1 Tax=Pseudoalteromonas fenneropenaei TaxID=1737459 RepID=A0ABV7CMQ6_9GAMM
MIFRSMSKNGFILMVFALGTTGAVALVQQLTKTRIADQSQQQLLQQLGEVLPAQYFDNRLDKDCMLSNAAELGPNGPHLIYRARLNGEPSALIVRHITPRGYSGNIDLITAIDKSGTVQGSRVTRHEETPGLGDKVEVAKSPWILSFAGTQPSAAKDPAFRVKRDGGQFDQFTGATITPRAVVHSVNDAAWYATQNFNAIFAAANACEEAAQ